VSEGGGNANESGPRAAPEGLSEFLTKILNQLSLSAWLPAALFVGAGAVLLEVHAQRKADLNDALKSLTAKPLGVIIVVVFALVLGTLVTQAFELAAIRWLEGYWPPVASRVGVTGTLVRYQAWRRHRAGVRLDKRIRRAFRVAREALLDEGVDQEIIGYLQQVAYAEQEKHEVSPEVKAAALALTWERFSAPHLLRSAEAAQRARSVYPARHRLMPTSLGNTLRAGEDRLRNVGDGPLRSFIIRNWHLLSTELRTVHNQYRTRLDMYCALVFVSGTLAIAGPALLLTGRSHHAAAYATFGSFVVLTTVCYKAAVTAAQGYVGVLMAVDQAVGAARQRRPGQP
jgi:hypothetical protein